MLHTRSTYYLASARTNVCFLQLTGLPNELLDLIYAYLPTSDLKSLSLVSRHGYTHAATFLWKTVCLIDTSRAFPNHDVLDGFTRRRGERESDEHDDTPIIQKLFVLARNTYIASQVQSVTHRCHLPTPNIFQDLPHIMFNGTNLSQDPRTLKLLQLAIRNMVNVQTLRIIFGHHSLTKGLLEGFLDTDRPRPLRRLWLESCSLLSAQLDLWPAQGLNALESIRFRRLRAEDRNVESRMGQENFRLARGGSTDLLANGSGNTYWTTVELPERPRHQRIPDFTQDQLRVKAEEFDTSIWRALPEIESFVQRLDIPTVRIKYEPPLPLIHILWMSTPTLRNLTLDWVIWRNVIGDTIGNTVVRNMVQRLSQLRFPHLRAFQVRNAVTPCNMLPDDLYLLEPAGDFATPMFLEFLEAHPKIKCLAWPLDRFFSHTRTPEALSLRIVKLIAHLGNTLVDLRVDSYVNGRGEPFTDTTSSENILDVQVRIRRRRFIAEFAPFMRKIEQIKLEGGIPRDEKREILRAMHWCPLQKVVLIGCAFPVGNTWGEGGLELVDLDDSYNEYDDSLEDEDKDALEATYKSKPLIPSNFQFKPEYGWPPSPPLLHTIAAHHASTVTSLKLCGFNGCPILTSPTPITDSLLYPLRHFHNLRELSMAMWLFTSFEQISRDQEIIKFWIDARSPSSTALVIVTPAGSGSATRSSSSRSSSRSLPDSAASAPEEPSPYSREQDFNRWEVILKTQFSPSALAYRVADDIGPYLSKQAKDREGGVRVRASFCLGAEVTDIFDLDIGLGRDNQVLQFVGPREEGERGKWWDKLEGRRWFD
ncbi:hypothetical protein GQ43DRAFT_406491 [Delitschia confertaspora ATCC 74209]|uniref:F-box domain-containing protein n=1 Tax=Delitschia confertaspora ATCC 74209 TaxID=1513339 RepID=A0A9P4JUM1_9PLEO|nr:hypothetical protein GQ43DRAFT_406491 [Delitschia confertaspora ATCC 74209]